jgi:hypothetical protein
MPEVREARPVPSILLFSDSRLELGQSSIAAALVFPLVVLKGGDLELAVQAGEKFGRVASTLPASCATCQGSCLESARFTSK